MAVNWISVAGKARKAFKKDFKEPMTITIITSGEYNISTGKTSNISVDYTTHGVIKAFEVEDFVAVSPGEVEILFHSGDPVDSIPDLTDQKNIEITAYGKVYKVKNIRAIRPAGITIMYKAIAVESKNAS